MDEADVQIVDFQIKLSGQYQRGREMSRECDIIARGETARRYRGRTYLYGNPGDESIPACLLLFMPTTFFYLIYHRTSPANLITLLTTAVILSTFSWFERAGAWRAQRARAGACLQLTVREICMSGGK